jgi:hypothetical protein
MKSITNKFIVIVIIGILTSVGYTVAYYSSGETIEVTVTNKERIVESEGDGVTSKYLVFTESEVFENEDALFLGKWNSSDVQGKLKVGETYTVKVIGWRVPFFSMYRNIVEIK